jgi:hypothetical protein
VTRPPIHHLSKEESTSLSEFLRVLAMPFQLAPLLFVVLTSILLGLFLGGDLIRMLLSIAAIWMLLTWLTQYALHLIDDAANGVRESAAASVEMVNPFDDPRAWVHPALAVGLGVLLYLHPDWPRVAVLCVAALLFPASIGACAISGHVIDAVHPGSMARVVRGLGPYYLLITGFAVAAALAGLWLFDRIAWISVRIAMLEMLLLLVYACIGGALYVRRDQLGFAPRITPDRLEERRRAERVELRQQWLDGLYRDLRVRESARAIGNAAQWFEAAAPRDLPGDVQALLEAGRQWTEPRQLPKLLAGLATHLLGRRQTALAFTVIEAGLAAQADFSCTGEAEAVQMIGYARQTGRRRTAVALLGNFLRSQPPGFAPGAELGALAATLNAAGSAAGGTGAGITS